MTNWVKTAKEVRKIPGIKKLYEESENAWKGDIFYAVG